MNGYKSTIGKDQMRQYMGALYEDSMVIFREYLQNACDAVEQALQEGLIPNRRQANIAVVIDTYNRNITIEDVGVGIARDNIGPYLVDVASSQKFNKNLVGKHGIGRLNGANYCDRIVYETSFSGEPIKSTLIWDVKKAKEMCADESLDIDTTGIIDAVTTLLPIEDEATDKHYCKVTLENINDPQLLDENAVRDYIAQIVSVAYSLEFKETVLKPGIEKEFNRNYKDRFDNLWVYQITVNEHPVEKTYRSEVNDKQLGTMQCFTIIDDKTQEELAWGWYALNKTAEQLNEMLFSYIRARHHNFQVGANDLLNKYHKSPTAAAYCVGELHITHPNIQPTATRDGIEGGPERRKLEIALKKYFAKIYEQYNKASKFRSEVVGKVAFLKIEEAKARLQLKKEDDPEEKKKLKETIHKKQEEIKAAQALLPKYQAYFGDSDSWYIAEDIVEAVNDSTINSYNSRQNVQLADAQIPSLKLELFMPEKLKKQNNENNPSDSSTTESGNEGGNTDTPNSPNSPTYLEEPKKPSPMDDYKGLSVVERNLVRKFLSVINSMNDIPEKVKDKMKAKLRKKIIK